MVNCNDFNYILMYIVLLSNSISILRLSRFFFNLCFLGKMHIKRGLEGPMVAPESSLEGWSLVGSRYNAN